jgi:NTP pyrophosphatase (non-canonical NTP hydrolase)
MAGLNREDGVAGPAGHRAGGGSMLRYNSATEGRTMASLRDDPTLKELQSYLALVCAERGWTKDSPSEKFVLFIEEVGELAKAMRKAAGLYEEQAKPRDMSLEEEFADVLSYLLDVANCFHVDLEQAFRAKEEINQSRIWE